MAELKGWTLKQLQNYLEGKTRADETVNYMDAGETHERSPYVQQLLAEVRMLPFKAAAEVAKVALETMAAKGS